MKVSLVVASGVHQGKVIPITGQQFLIGRDPQCHLRPASQAVSKQHCGVIIRDGQVFLRDYGSTNGTVLNDTIVKGAERQLAHNDVVKIGPLDFTIRIEPSSRAADGTPLPDMNPETAAALAAVKAVSAATGKKPTAGTPTPSPKAPPAKPGAPSSGSKETVATSARTPSSDDAQDQDKIAAMLLGLSDDDVPEGNTVVDMPIVPTSSAAEGAAAEAKADEKKDAKKGPSREDTSNAANEILRKYMRRPK